MAREMRGRRVSEGGARGWDLEVLGYVGGTLT